MSTSDEDSSGFANVEVVEGDPQLTDEDFEAWGQSEDLDDMPHVPPQADPAAVLPSSGVLRQALVPAPDPGAGVVSTDHCVIQGLDHLSIAAADAGSPAPPTFNRLAVGDSSPAETASTVTAALPVEAARTVIMTATGTQPGAAADQATNTPVPAPVAVTASFASQPEAASEGTTLAAPPLGPVQVVAKATPKKLGAKKLGVVKPSSAEAPPSTPASQPESPAVLPDALAMQSPPAMQSQPPTSQAPPAASPLSDQGSPPSSSHLSKPPSGKDDIQPNQTQQSQSATVTAALLHKLNTAQMQSPQSGKDQTSSRPSFDQVPPTPKSLQRGEQLFESPVPVRVQSMSVSSEIEEAQEAPPRQQVWGGGGRTDSGSSSRSSGSSVEPQASVFGWPGGVGGWGLGGWGQAAARLKEAAAGAVRDVTELTETFKQALVDVAEDDEFPLGAADHAANRNQTSSYATASTTAAHPNPTFTASPHPAASGDSVPDMEHVSHGQSSSYQSLSEARERERGMAAGLISAESAGRGDEREELLREQVLLRLQAAGEGGRDTSMEVGLKAIDDQVEQLASGAARAFSSLWGGLRNVGAAIASQAEGSSLQDAAARLASKAEKGLESMGRAALGLLDAGEIPNQEQQQQQPYVGDHTSYDGSHEEDAQPQHYDDFLYIYGGVQLSEEMSELSNDCARLCNKSRARLEPSQQELLDHTLASLAPHFTDLLTSEALHPSPSSRRRTRDHEGRTQLPVASPFLPVQSHISNLDSEDGSGADRLLAMYAPVQYLCEDSAIRAQAFSEQLQATLQPRAVSLEKHSADEDMVRAQGEEDGSSGEAVAAVGAVAAAEIQGRVLGVLSAHSAKRVAEICTAQVQLLLNYGASVAAPARIGRPADDGIVWPVDHFQQASLLQQETRRMLEDLHSVTSVYCTTVAALLDTLQAHTSRGSAKSVSSAESAHTVAGAELARSVTPAQSDQSVASAQGETASGHADQADGSRGLNASQEHLQLSTQEGASDPRGMSDVEHRATVLLHALVAQGASAMSRVQDAFKGLLYTVLLRSIVTEIA